MTLRCLLRSRPGHRVVVLLALGLCAPGLAGCVAVAAGGAAYGAYKAARNDVERDFRADLDTTWKAAIDALQENGLPIAAQAAHGPTSGILSVADVVVRVEAHAQGFTRVSVRIGTFETDEHRRRADLILTSIARRLGG